MSTDLIPRDRQTPALLDLGRAANEAARRHAFADYQDEKSERTLRRQAGDLAVFAEFLAEIWQSAGLAGRPPLAEALGNHPLVWKGITWGLVKSFRNWQRNRGFAIGTINLRLSTVRTYARLAFEAGILSEEEERLISGVRGYGNKAGRHIDEKRAAADVPTRIGAKKAEPVALTRDEVNLLKGQPDTGQGRRDALIICLLADLGLRVGEVATLTVGAFDLASGELRFYRPKVDKTQIMTLSPDGKKDTLQAAQAYIAKDALAVGPLLRRSRKDGALYGAGMTVRAINARVRTLGLALGIEGLSPHDLRHYWATRAARSGTPMDRLKQAGGWSSLSMPDRYIQEAEIANEGIRLD